MQVTIHILIGMLIVCGCGHSLDAVAGDSLIYITRRVDDRLHYRIRQREIPLVLYHLKVCIITVHIAVTVTLGLAYMVA